MRTMTALATAALLLLGPVAAAAATDARFPRIYTAMDRGLTAAASEPDPLELLVQRALQEPMETSLRAMTNAAVRPQWRDLEAREAWLLTAMRDLYRDRGYRPIFIRGATLAPAADILLTTLQSAWTHGLNPSDYIDDELTELLRILRTPIEDPDLRHQLSPDAATWRTLQAQLALRLAQQPFAVQQGRAITHDFDLQIRAIMELKRATHATAIRAELDRKAQAASHIELTLAAALVRYAIDMRLGNDFFAPSDPALDVARDHLVVRGYNESEDTDGTRTGAPPIPAKVGDLLATPDEWRLDSFDALLAAAEGVVDFQAALDALPLNAPDYAPLRDALLRYHAIADAGGWATLDPPPTTGDADPWHRALTARLAVEEHPTLASWKAARQLPADDAVDELTLAALNTPVSERIAQLELALAKLRNARYAHDVTAASTHIRVNVPSFRAELWDQGEAQYQWRVIVGKVSSQGINATPEMSAILTEIELNPYWYPPRRLMRADAPQRFVPPGPNNPMGRAKFLFPNADAIYMHDTNHRDRFGSTFRAYSSGCVRVDQAEALASVLISRDRGHTREAGDAFVAQRLSGGARYRYYLRRPLPVHIEYRTAFMQDGVLHFGIDLYGRDHDELEARIATIQARYPRLPAERARDRHARTQRLARRAPLALGHELARVGSD